MTTTMTRTNCVYCNKEITNRSREHVIHNALGGLYESEDICCPECNNYISRAIDAPFTKSFNPIIGRIANFSKTNKTALPPCTGTIEYNGKQYTDAIIKGDKVVGCASLSQQLRGSIKGLDLPIVSYNFDIDNAAFQTGMAKIAFNYALDKGVDLNLLKPGMEIKDTGEISFSYPVIPFCPLNPVDAYLELQTPPEIYHNMILFSQHNTLWCYIDLFNTFQYYVLLTDKLPTGTHIYDSYAQTVQRLNRDMPELNIWRAKDIMVYAQQYGVEPCTDEKEFTRRVKNAIEQKSQKTTLQKLLTPKIARMDMISMASFLDTPADMMALARSCALYFDESNQLQEPNFRTITYDVGGELLSYPYLINEIAKQNQDGIKMYTTAKFNRLNSLLCTKTK